MNNTITKDIANIPFLNNNNKKKDATNNRSISGAKQELQNRKQELTLQKAIFSNDQDSGKEEKEHSPELTKTKKRTNSLRKQAVTQQPEQPATPPANRIRSATEFLPRSLGSLPDPVRLLPLALPRRRAAVLPPRLPVPRRLWWGGSRWCGQPQEMFLPRGTEAQTIIWSSPSPAANADARRVLCECLTLRADWPPWPQNALKTRGQAFLPPPPPPLFSFVFFSTRRQVKSMSHD
jgi:hypothetical protein